VKRRRAILTAAVAAAGLAALGTVVAQQPAPTGSNAPVTTVRPYSEWTPTAPPPGYSPKQPTGVPPASGYLPPPPGYTPQNGGVQPAGGTKPRLTSPATAGEGVRPASATQIPAPNMEVPSFRPSTPPPPVASVPGVPALPSVPAVPSLPGVPPAPKSDPSESKFPPTALPTPVTTNRNVTPPAVPAISAPSSPFTAPATPMTPNEFPAAPPSVTTLPSVPPAASAVPPATGPATTNTPATPSTTLAPGVLPSRAAPSLSIEAVCPETVAYGQELTYKLIVRNTGTSAVSGIRVDDELPSGSRFVGSDPVAELNGDRLNWTLGTIDGGGEKTITIRVKPSEEGESRSRATVSFMAQIDARTRVTRPRIAISATSAEVCRAGEEASFQIKVTNSGSGPAPKYVIRAQLSDGLLHSQGTVIEAPMEMLPAGETKTVQLKVAAAKAGLQWCHVTVTADGSPDATAKASTNVVEPLLVVKQSGPAKCLVRAELTFTIELSNPGTAATDPVLLQSVMPDGFEWVNQASDGGTCSGRTMTWRLPALPAGSNRSVTVKLRAVAATDPQGSSLRTVAQAGPANVAPAGAGATAVRGGRGLEAKAETTVVAEGVAAVRFDVIGLENPVAVGKEVTYEIRVMNSGTGPCSNVQMAAALAEGTEFVGATTGTNQTGAVKATGQQLSFDPIPSLGVKGEMIYRVRVKSNVAGEHRLRVQMSCDQLKTPVVKEESTTFVKE
jgi:uncharacterized repeat protein (TIGR01451 family)